MYSIQYSKQAIKVKSRMPKGISERMAKELTLIAVNPSSYQGDWKPMQGTSLWRLRVGDWRAICEVVDEVLTVFVLKIGARGDVYK